MLRATFELRFAGPAESADGAVESLAESLAEQGFVLDEDFIPTDRAGIRFHTLDALRAALDLLPGLGAYMVETDRASV